MIVQSAEAYRKTIAVQIRFFLMLTFVACVSAD